VIANSGLNVTVPVATISGVFVASGSLSGQITTVLSGTLFPASGVNVVVPKETLSGIVANSGLNVTATATVSSGDVFLASGHNLFWSGQLYLNSGLNVGLLSGQTVGVYSGNLSGQRVDLTSGQSYPASGVFAAGAALSGQTYLASGSVFATTFASGIITRAIPEGVLKVNFSGITGEADRSLLNAARKLSNKWDLGVTASGVLTVFKEDDTTTAYTQNVGATSGASPVTSLDTNN